MPSANSLLYGPRAAGPGPKPAPLAFALFKENLIAGNLPDFIVSACPEISLVVANDEAWAGLAEGETFTQAYLLGLSEKDATLSAVRDGQEKIIALDYALFERDTLPGNDIERRLFRALAEEMDEPVSLEVTAYNDHQLRAILDSYNDGHLALTISEFGRNVSEKEALDDIAARVGLPEKTSDAFESCATLGEIVARPDGQAILEDALRFDSLTFTRPIATLK